ncbi:MAG: hypothetical protein PVS2B3_14470 [Steroidobacteraceae bacterium]
MSVLQRIAAAALAALLLAAGYGLWSTRSPPLARAQAARTSASPDGVPVIDRDTFAVAERLSRLVRTPEEIPLAQQAVQLADHELDLAFGGALRQIEAHPPPLSPEAQQIQQRLSAAQQRLQGDTASVKRLTAELAQASDAGKPAIQDRLDLAQSQLELTQDEVEQASNDLLAAGGNVHQRMQMMQQEHDALSHIADTQAPIRIAPAAASSGLASLHGLAGHVRSWLAIRDTRLAISAARAQVEESVATLAAERSRFVADAAASRATLAGGHAPAAPAVAPPALLALTRQAAADQHSLALRDERITTRQRMAATYAQWEGLLAAQQRAASHACLADAAMVLAALLALLFANSWLDRLLEHSKVDRRQLQTLRSVIGVALQIVGVIVILLVLVGLPGQLGTMLGLAGAGLTVALKDFIVAFIGWFVLMGRNGVRLGDWVEINGVSGEVTELGMFHTVLLETGNWTDAGHPTGRRVTFTNSFAIEGHYFNFSTTGQWLWDEVSVVVPFGRDTQAIATAIEKEAVAATANSGTEAEAEWRRASRGQRGASVSAQPGVAMRPTGGGVEIVVRYVTRASERLAVRARLYQSAVQLLAQGGGTPA